MNIFDKLALIAFLSMINILSHVTHLVPCLSQWRWTSCIHFHFYKNEVESEAKGVFCVGTVMEHQPAHPSCRYVYYS